MVWCEKVTARHLIACRSERARRCKVLLHITLIVSAMPCGLLSWLKCRIIRFFGAMRDDGGLGTQVWEEAREDKMRRTIVELKRTYTVRYKLVQKAEERKRCKKESWLMRREWRGAQNLGLPHFIFTLVHPDFHTTHTPDATYSSNGSLFQPRVIPFFLPLFISLLDHATPSKSFLWPIRQRGSVPFLIFVLLPSQNWAHPTLNHPASVSFQLFYTRVCTTLCIPQCIGDYIRNLVVLFRWFLISSKFVLFELVTQVNLPATKRLIVAFVVKVAHVFVQNV